MQNPRPIINFRLGVEDLELVNQYVDNHGYSNISDLIRDALSAYMKVEITTPKQRRRRNQTSSSSSE